MRTDSLNYENEHSSWTKTPWQQALRRDDMGWLEQHHAWQHRKTLYHQYVGWKVYPRDVSSLECRWNNPSGPCYRCGLDVPTEYINPEHYFVAILEGNIPIPGYIQQIEEEMDVSLPPERLRGGSSQQGHDLAVDAKSLEICRKMGEGEGVEMGEVFICDACEMILSETVWCEIESLCLMDEAAMEAYPDDSLEVARKKWNKYDPNTPDL